MTATSREDEPSAPRLRLLEYLDWKINPVLLRDLRLYTRGRLLMLGYFLTLAALVVLTILYAVVVDAEGGDGRTLLSIITTIVAVVTGALVPNLVFERFRSEFANRATELALMSPLTPARLVRGKLMGAWCVSLIVLATATPMLASAYLLGGVNIFSLLGIAAGLFLIALIMPTPQLLMATQRQARSMSRIIASSVFISQLIMMFSYASFLCGFFIYGAGREEFGILLLSTVAVGGTLAAQFLYFVTVSRLRGENEYRDAAPRVSLSVAALLGGCVALAVMMHISGTVGRSGFSLWQIISIVSCFVAYTFPLGFLLITYTVPSPPRLPGVNRPGWIGRTFLRPGVRSLAAYFLVNALPLILFVEVPLLARLGEVRELEDEWRYVTASMAPIMAVAMGLNIYYYLVLPFVRNRRSPNLLPLTIIVGNLAVGLFAVCALVLTGLADSRDLLHLAVAASNPLGLLYGVSASWRVVPTIGLQGNLFLALQFLLLVPIALGWGGRRLLPREQSHGSL